MDDAAAQSSASTAHDPSVVDPPPPVPARGSREGRAWRRYSWVMAAVWLAFLSGPFEQAATTPNRVAGVVALAALTAFVVVYLRPWLPSRSRDSAWTSRPMARRWYVRDLGVLVVLTLLTLPGAGLAGLTCLIFVSTYALMTLPLRFALPPITGLLLVGAIVGWTVPGARELQGIVEGDFFACVAVFGISRMIERTNELATANQNLARLAVAEERSRFARDLHDLLGHSLTVVTLKAELAGRLLEADSDAGRARAASEVADIERLARDALGDVRAALAGYREVSLGTELAGARQALAAAGITAQLPGAVDDIPADRRELFGWVVREGVTNVVRHSGARHCWVEVGPSEVAVCDDGRGPTPDSQRGAAGSGLGGLADRARAAGASLTVGRSSAGGFSVRVRMADTSTSPTSRLMALVGENTPEGARSPSARQHRQPGPPAAVP